MVGEVGGGAEKIFFTELFQKTPYQCCVSVMEDARVLSAHHTRTSNESLEYLLKDTFIMQQREPAVKWTGCSFRVKVKVRRGKEIK